MYRKAVGAVEHVFVSRLRGGAFQAPEEVDSALTADSSQPVVAVGDGGLVLIAFINGESLYVVTRTGAAAPWSEATKLADGAGNPSLAVSIHGKGYLAFTAAGAGGHDVRAAYYHGGHWALAPTALDAVPGEDAGAGLGRPRVAACGDGVGIVVWGEAGHIYSRRVWASAPSVVYEQADVPTVSGWRELSADQPEIASGDDSSYANIVWHEVIGNGVFAQSRVLMRRLRGSRYESLATPDGLRTPAAEGAVSPQIAESDYSDGFITSARDASNQVYATFLKFGGVSDALVRVDSLASVTPPHAVTTTNGLFSGLVAWQHDPGPSGVPDVRFRLSEGNGFGPETVASSPALGPTDASRGLFAAGDFEGDVVIAWVQGIGASTQIVTAQLWHPPAGFAPIGKSGYVRTARPVVAWSPAGQQWGTVTYTVSVDGSVVAQTTSTALRLPALGEGPHRWQVTAANQAGAATAAATVSLFVDRIAPTLSFTVAGPMRARSRLRLRPRYADLPPTGLPAADASGVSAVTVDWGDGTRARLPAGASHTYARPGRYRVTVSVRDRAGNAATLTRALTIATPTKSKPRKRK